MNLRIDTDASLLTASQGMRRTRAARASEQPVGRATHGAARDEAVTTQTSVSTSVSTVTSPATDPSSATERAVLTSGQITAQPTAAVHAQANSTPESVLRLLY